MLLTSKHQRVIVGDRQVDLNVVRDDEFLTCKGRVFHNKAPLYEKLLLYSDVDRGGNAKLLLLTFRVI